MSVFVFSQNLKLDSLKVYSSLGESQNEVITTHFLFENCNRVVVACNRIIK